MSPVVVQKTGQEANYKKRFIGSTLFLLGNSGNKNKPDFVQLNFGDRITPKDVVSIELKAWKYWLIKTKVPVAFETLDKKMEQIFFI